MLSSRLEKLAEVIMENETNPNIDKDIIVYGFNSAIEQGMSFVTAVVLGSLFGLGIEVIIFLVSFTLIRTYAGGYHYFTRWFKLHEGNTFMPNST